MNYDIIGKVQAGDRLDDVVEESGEWYSFCCLDGDKPGWLHSSLVRHLRLAGRPHTLVQTLLPEILECRGCTNSSP